MQFKLKLIQTFSEALLPILGYFLWNWSLFDILLFYFLDLIASTFFTFLKIQKTQSFQKINTKNIDFLLYSLVLYIGIIFCTLQVLPLLIPKFDVFALSFHFFMLKDMGIPQGYFLIPLVFYAGYLQYKMHFLQNKQFEKCNLQKLKKSHLMALVLLFSVITFLLGISHFILFPSLIYILIIIGFTSVYSLTQKSQ